MISGWQDRAACRDADPALFDARGEDESLTDVRERVEYVATRYCTGCPVWNECLLFQRQHRYQGVWAGSMRSADHRPHRRAAAGACGTDAGFQRHAMLGTDPCLACRDARLDAEAQGKALPRCGTYPAVRRHRSRNEACVTCSAWLDASGSQRLLDGSPRCGTFTGYQHHVSAGEPVDQACMLARDRYLRRAQERKRDRRRDARRRSHAAALKAS